jgi:hypothetical protein
VRAAVASMFDVHKVYAAAAKMFDVCNCGAHCSDEHLAIHRVGQNRTYMPYISDNPCGEYQAVLANPSCLALRVAQQC